MDAGQGSVRHVSFLSARGQVAGNGFPVIALIEGAVKFVGAEIEHVLLVATQPDGRLPVIAGRAFAQVMLRADGFERAGAAIYPKIIAQKNLNTSKYSIGGEVQFINQPIGILSGQEANLLRQIIIIF